MDGHGWPWEPRLTEPGMHLNSCGRQPGLSSIVLMSSITYIAYTHNLLGFKHEAATVLNPHDKSKQPLLWVPVHTSLDQVLWSMMLRCNWLKARCTLAPS